MGVTYVDVHIIKVFKSRASLDYIDKCLWVISTLKQLYHYETNEYSHFNKYCMHCYVILSNIF